MIAGRIALYARISSEGQARDNTIATLGVGEYNPIRRDRRLRLDELRTALGGSLPTHARAKIVRMLDRLECC